MFRQFMAISVGSRPPFSRVEHGTYCSALTVLTHRKLRQANVEAELNVFEGMSHIHFILNPYAPESREVFTDWARFFDMLLVH